MKIRTLMMMPLISILMVPTFNAQAETNKGQMTLELSGEIDMNINASSVQYVKGVLNGTTAFTGSPIYSEVAQDSWEKVYALITLSHSSTRCGTNFVSKIPGQTDKYGIRLKHVTNPNAAVYVIPEFNYNVSISDFQGRLNNSYTGRFFQNNSGVIDLQTPAVNICYIPNNYVPKVPAGGTKRISVTSPGNLPIYIDEYLTPGRLVYEGVPFFVSSFGKTAAGDFNLKVNVHADILVKRSCAITGVTNQTITENMTSTNELIRDSQFNVSCGGLGNPINISAVTKEGTVDPSNSRKLQLAPINGTVSDKKPWVMGLPYAGNTSPTLTCSDENNSRLLRFNNTSYQLDDVVMGNNTVTPFGIKWALCKPDYVKAGAYRGKVDVNIFVRG